MPQATTIINLQFHLFDLLLGTAVGVYARAMQVVICYRTGIVVVVVVVVGRIGASGSDSGGGRLFITDAYRLPDV